MIRLRQVTRLSSLGITLSLCLLLFNVYPNSDDDREMERPVSRGELLSGDGDFQEPLSGCSRKNVLLLIADDMRPQISAYRGEDYPDPKNNPPIYTPNIDSLASNSLLLKRTYAQWSSCGPSRASFLTGRRPHTTKVWDLHTSWRNSGGNFTSLPQYFKENGYTTAGMGKVFHPIDGPEENDPLSWTLPYYEPPNLAHWSRVSTVGVSWKAVSKAERTNTPLEDEQTTKHTLHTLRRLAPKAKTCEQPFFVAAGFHKPHLPFVFPEEFLELYPFKDVHAPANMYAPRNMPAIAWDDFIELRRYLDIKKIRNKGNINETLPIITMRQLRRAYYASVSYVDNLVGDILQELKRLKLDESTIVAFVGDHGFSLGENGEWAKHSNFEQALHVPLMIKVPGLTDSGLQSRALSELVDLFPTLVDAAGLRPIPTCPEISTNVSTCTEGTSLMPLVVNATPDVKDLAFSQHKRNLLRMGYTARSDRFRYTEWVQISRSWSSYERWDFHNNWDNLLGVELYDHDTDPLENDNLAYDPVHAKVCAEFRSRLRQHFRETIFDFPRNSKSLFLDY